MCYHFDPGSSFNPPAKMGIQIQKKLLQIHYLTKRGDCQGAGCSTLILSCLALVKVRAVGYLLQLTLGPAESLQQ